MPLGQPYRGTCQVLGREPDPDIQKTLCNFGYARKRCSDFPAESAVDAIRFSIHTEGRFIWIEEAAGAPVQFGEGEGARPKLFAAFERSCREGKVHQ